MPTYDYRCDACEHQFEHFQSMTSPVLRKCPDCGRQKLRRLIGAGAGLIFKGSGFYITDYRGDGYEKAKKDDKEPAAKKESKADSKTDSKAESKTDGGDSSKQPASSKPEKKVSKKKGGD